MGLPHLRRLLLPGIALLLAASLTHCAATPRRVDAGPIKLVSHHREPGSPILVIDSQERFQAGVEAYRRGDYREAIGHFSVVLEHFPDTDFGARSRYNLGVCQRALEQWREAAQSFTDYLSCCSRDDADRLDALLFIMEAQENQELWEAVLKTGRAIRRLKDAVNDEVRLEMLVRSGHALLEMDELDRAETTLLTASNLYIRSKGAHTPLDPSLGAAAYLLRGGVAVKRFDRTRISDDSEEAAMASMNAKSRHLLEAQQLLLQCIMEGQAFYAAAAGFETGRMYEDFYRDIVDKPLPAFASKDPEDALLYQCMLKEFVLGMVRKALVLYNEVLNLGQRTGLESVWIDRTRQRIEGLEALYARDNAACEPLRPAYQQAIKNHLEKLRQGR